MYAAASRRSFSDTALRPSILKTYRLPLPAARDTITLFAAGAAAGAAGAAAAAAGGAAAAGAAAAAAGAIRDLLALFPSLWISIPLRSLRFRGGGGGGGGGGASGASGASGAIRDLLALFPTL